MKRRIFIAIGLPEEVRWGLGEAVEKWRWLPIRWLSPANWHVTVIPPSYVKEDEFPAVKTSLEKLAKSLQPFELSFDSIILAPPDKRARMIWLSGPRNTALQELKEKIEEEFMKNGQIPAVEKEERALLPHITLARFEEGALKDIEQRTRTLEEFKASFPVAALDIMESHLKSTGAEYERLASVPLGEKPLLPPYEFLPHTADLRIKSRGKTLEELFENSLLGMAEYMKKGAAAMKATVTRPIEIVAPDTAALLVDFLSHTLALADANQEVYSRAAFDEFSETHLKGTLFGAAVGEFDRDIKAVTYHEAAIQKAHAGYEVTIIYDI